MAEKGFPPGFAEAVETAARALFADTIEAATDRVVNDRLAAIEAAVRISERASIAAVLKARADALAFEATAMRNRGQEAEGSALARTASGWADAARCAAEPPS